MNQQEIYELFRRLQKTNPEPKTELEYTNPYTLLVAVVLSAQSTDKGVNKATRSLFAKVSSPEEMLELGEEGLKEHIKAIGLFNNKAKSIMAFSKILAEDYGGKIPRSREELVKLPGVGRKTANVVLNAAFGQHTIAVDTHVARVANRTGMATSNKPEKVEAELEECIPEEFLEHAHHWLILHGRYICTARKPGCRECPISDICRYENKTGH
jgi:endonuclease-3